MPTPKYAKITITNQDVGLITFTYVDPAGNSFGNQIGNVTKEYNVMKGPMLQVFVNTSDVQLIPEGSDGLYYITKNTAKNNYNNWMYYFRVASDAEEVSLLLRKRN